MDDKIFNKIQILKSISNSSSWLEFFLTPFKLNKIEKQFEERKPARCIDCNIIINEEFRIKRKRCDRCERWAKERGHLLNNETY